MNIETNLDRFLEDMSLLKYDLINALSSLNVEKYRYEYKGRYSPERFKEFFIEKTALHTVFKYLLIRMIEESMKRVNVKLGKDGLKKWHEMSKNFREDYDLLFEISVDDVRREQDFQAIFQDTIYDNQQIIRYIKPIIKKHIPILSNFNFNTLDSNTTLTIIDTIYNVEERNELQKLQSSPVIDFIMNQLGLE
jgi:hypothetical protein